MGGGSAPLFYSGLGLRVERDVKQNKIQPCGSDGHVTSASGGPELVQLLPIVPKHKSCKNHSYRAWYCVGLVTKSCPALATSRTVACQVLSMGFSRQEYWSGLPFPSPLIVMDTAKKKIRPRKTFLLCFFHQTVKNI